MIPPLPTINDAIGLLASLADKDRTQKLLEKMQEHAAGAGQALEAARAAQKAADDARAELEAADKRRESAWNDLAARSSQVAAEEAALEKHRQEHKQNIASWEANWRERSRGLIEQKEQAETRAADLSARGKEMDARIASLQAREKAVTEREQRAKDILAEFAPLAEKLKL